MRLVVADTSPIFYLLSIGQIELLPRLTLLNRCGFGQSQEIPVGAGHSIVEAVRR